ncbi:MAG: hypothetical protein M1819_000342 [Sarea resinae]|nr:MAG: hypothetical protein M1819_000342 [Sarea resinae]
MVLWLAWRQLWEARALMKEINLLGESAYRNMPLESMKTTVDPPPDCPCTRPERPNPPAPIASFGQDAPKNAQDQFRPEKRFEPWTMQQAFFTVMGGFAVESSSFCDSPAQTFTPAGILELAKAGLLPRISIETIEDKSKADEIAKLFVCVQTAWFLIQSLTRLGEGLPLTLLEIHTLTHILCCWCMYAMWFNKPYNVGTPIWCTDQDTINMAALLAFDCESVTIRDSKEFARQRERIEEAITRRLIENAVDNTADIEMEQRFQSTEGSDLRSLTDVRSGEEDDRPAILETRGQVSTNRDGLDSNTTVVNTRMEDDQVSDYPASSIWSISRGRCCQTDSLELQQVQALRPDLVAENRKLFVRIELANRAIARLRERGSHFRWEAYGEGEVDLHRTYMTDYHMEILVQGSVNPIKPWKWVGTIDPTEKPEFYLYTLAGLAFVAMYGGIHLSAWNVHFPTAVEMWMWRAAGLSSIAFALAMAVCDVSLAIHSHPRVKRFRVWSSRINEGDTKGPWELCLRILGASVAWPGCVLISTLGTMYGYGRFFFTAEAFASLRSLPVGNFQQVQWPSFIPHAVA